MKNRKVLNLRTHIAGVLAKTTYDAKMHGADMEMTAVGVLIKSVAYNPHVTNVMVPWANIVESVLAPDLDEEKRGPGRPPKEVA